MDLSSPGSLIASLVVGSIGLGLFMYGKRMSRTPQLAVGVSLMAFPYFVTGLVPMLSTAGVLLGGLWFTQRGGKPLRTGL